MARVNPQLLAKLIESHGAALRLYAAQSCAAPDDVVQQALIDFTGCAPVPDNPVAWLFVAVRRRASNYSRAERKRQRHEAAAAERWFEREREQTADAQLASEALAALPLDQREIVVAHLWGRLSFKEVGRLIDCSSSTAQRRYETAIERLRERMKGRCLKNER